MKIDAEIINKATEWNINELYNYLQAISLDKPEVNKQLQKAKNGINIKLDINYYIQPTMKKYLQNKGRQVYLHKKPLTNIEELYNEMDKRKALLLNTLISMQQAPSLSGR